MTEIIEASEEAGRGVPSPPKENLFRADFNPDLEVREAEDGRTIMYGHFARFDEWTEINSVVEGRFMEKLSPGSLTKTISEGARRMKVLFQHGQDVLGQQILGPIQDLREDDQGGYYEVPLFDGVPQLILSGLRAKAYGASFRFNVMLQDWNEKPKRSDFNPTGLPERTILEARVAEFGPVTFPAYAGATAGLRSLTDDFLVGRLVDNPERLLEIVEAMREQRGRHDDNRAVEPEPSEATTQTPEKPERSVATTFRATGRHTGGLFTTTRKEKPQWHL